MIAQAWHVVAFDRTKRLPELQPIVDKIVAGKAKRQSPEDLLRVVERLNKVFGGVDRRAAKGK
jgi:hypothetical protein